MDERTVDFGDSHALPSAVTNITHVDPTLGQHGVRIDFRLFVLLVCLSTMAVGEFIGLLVLR